ncbi:MAG: hypothetical protein RBR62_07515 [Bacteroidales bacterium]|jgi:hypothetical protein|nr:hypothetical protein [Bacteroidales bacterium]HKM31342.1 hypothetical protein [Bacteroidales bacterium]
MKALFIAFYQAFYEEILEVLNKHQITGYTFWEEVRGSGSRDGEPHLGTHAWPALNSVLITFVPNESVDPIMEDLKVLDESAPKQGLRVFVLNAEERTV